MGIENRVKFEAKWNDETTELKSYMVFEVSPWDGDMYETKVEVSCYEDVEIFFKLYFEENWKDCFKTMMFGVLLSRGCVL